MAHEDLEIELTVLMPCLNEAETLESCILAARTGIERAGVRGEILIADNGSTDASREIARRLGARVAEVAERGYGSALRGGIAEARGRFVIMGDADASYDFTDLTPFLERLRAGDDLVMGCRMPRGGGRILPGAMPWKHRWIGNPVLSALARFLFRSDISDFHCGLRGFSRSAFAALGLVSGGMEFASEMIVKAVLAGLRISEVPVTLSPDKRSRPPHLRSWRDGWRHLRFMLLISPTWLFLVPGLLLAGMGFVAGARLSLGPLVIGPYGFESNALVVSSMTLLVGVQVTLYGVMAHVLAVRTGLLPERSGWRSAFRLFTLERGLLTGSLLVVVGFLLVVRVVVRWHFSDLGPLPTAETMRMVVPGATAVTLGTQVLFSSFFLSALGTTVVESPARPEAEERRGRA
ncbi:MAG: glycosyltransferase family 2 protein [Thermoanaerobaculia bacterium]